MSNLTKLDFVALDVTGNNYLSWVLDAEIHLQANALGETIKDDNEASDQDKAKALIFIRHHLSEGLKNEYLTIKDPLILWNNLKERYDHQKTVILPRALDNWVHLRLQDFKSVSEYNSTLFKIVSQLRLCGENITDKEMLEKTFSTFHASNLVLQQQYREKGFTKYSQLISCLLVAEQNNDLLLKNHQSRPTGTAPYPEVNVTTYGQNVDRYRGRGRNYGRGRGRNGHHNRNIGRGRGRGRGNGTNFNNSYFRPNFKSDGRMIKDQGGPSNQHHQNMCNRCGGSHWTRICRTPKHLVGLYQESKRGKKIETNLVFEEGAIVHENNDTTHLDVADYDTTHLDVADFFVIPEGKFDSDENVQK
ncbi:hypothetical protein LINPERHAP1_LOCUS23595 [Linum perenne]